MLSLRDVTLIAIDCAAHDLTRLALLDTVHAIMPAGVQLWSDIRPDIPAPEGCQFHPAHNQSARDAFSMLWYEAPNHIATSHALNIQYDGWVLDASRWRDEFLEYDYIGAPWPWHPNRRVGNGGFSLRSTKLLRFLRDHMDEFPLTQRPEDDLLCRVYRPALEAHGFRWAPERLARQFSFERDTPRPAFGFHGIFNLPNVLSPERLAERMALANDYVRGKSEWREIAV
jgi:Protein of unknown function (DUF5672)